MQSFLDVTLPPLILLVAACGVLAAVTVVALGRLRLYAAQRRRITVGHTSLTTARDALAFIIAAPDASQDIKDEALRAYTALNVVTKDGKREA